MLRVQVASYMGDPKAVMNLTVQFSRLPEGLMVIDGVSKQLNIAILNSKYQHR